MPPEPNRNSPAVALVTGAANRLGAAMAQTLASRGYAVIIHHRSGGDDARALVERIVAAGGRAAALKADLAIRRQRAALIEKAGRPFGPLTVLVNNASSFEPDSVADLDEQLWDRHFAIHVEAPAFLARDFAAQLPEGVQGNIVNLIDERILHLTPNYFSYTLSKATLRTMTHTMAQSLAPRIRVNAIGPGPTLKEKGQSDAAFARSQAAAPLGYGADATDVCAALLYLLEARAVTGQMLAVDGGKSLDFPAQRGPTPRRPAS
ncbi:MAG TPA: SDR family oxidoreductase [Devosia sp.]|jgi:NAD(P)-dependent dehydrogenase (short-subunit alcohol dehydrogenase family)|nr:SDR family oxidoreductase [Devosia sp.]